MRSAFAALACVLVLGCAKASPDASTSPSPKATAEATTAPTPDAATSADGGHAFGLPMPQQYPHFVWDAAAAGHGR